MFSRVNPSGWNFKDTLTSAQMNQLDLQQSRAIDGYNQGSYNITGYLDIETIGDSMALTSGVFLSLTSISGTVIDGNASVIIRPDVSVLLDPTGSVEITGSTLLVTSPVTINSSGAVAITSGGSTDVTITGGDDVNLVTASSSGHQVSVSTYDFNVTATNNFNVSGTGTMVINPDLIVYGYAIFGLTEYNSDAVFDDTSNVTFLGNVSVGVSGSHSGIFSVWDNAQFYNDLTVGSSSGDSFTINATTTFAYGVNFNSDVQLGNGTGDTITFGGYKLAKAIALSPGDATVDIRVYDEIHVHTGAGADTITLTGVNTEGAQFQIYNDAAAVSVTLILPDSTSVTLKYSTFQRWVYTGGAWVKFASCDGI